MTVPPGADSAPAPVNEGLSFTMVIAVPETRPVIARAPELVREKLPLLAKLPSVPTALAAWLKAALAAEPVRVPTCSPPPGWVMAPETASVVVPVVATVPARARFPVTFSVAALAESGPRRLGPGCRSG